MQMKPRGCEQRSYEDIEVVCVTLYGYDSKEAADEARCKKSFQGKHLASRDFLYEGKSSLECLLTIEVDANVFVFILPSVCAMSKSGSCSKEVPAEQTLILIGPRARIADSSSMDIMVKSPKPDEKKSGR
eukprot:CAMPEP_0167774464 /NCGR_PEP_ID=MMETSP0111_2-20121227/2016_1 /TAXON_ID=91324 /ORGANISM="Lotharella globosa, Strain CCCM811" /LENGTH=129 /DNA_ID=CAMNT_0007664267 /DNA_START=197 /DNA_END=586 /DNA_ORIENTATION=+